MTKLDAGLITSLPASDPGSAAVWGSKRINPRPQFCLCLAWSGCPSNDDDDDDTESFVDPITGAHTQNIVSIWNVCKYHIKQKKGVLGSKMKIMLQEFVWKHNIGKRIDMEALFELIKVI